MRPGRVESNQRAAQYLCLSGSSDPGLGSCCWAAAWCNLWGALWAFGCCDCTFLGGWGTSTWTRMSTLSCVVAAFANLVGVTGGPLEAQWIFYFLGQGDSKRNVDVYSRCHCWHSWCLCVGCLLGISLLLMTVGCSQERSHTELHDRISCETWAGTGCGWWCPEAQGTQMAS